jgi:hypothetical protein
VGIGVGTAVGVEVGRAVGLGMGVGDGKGLSVAGGTSVCSENGVSVDSSGSGISSMGVGVCVSPVAGICTAMVGARVGTEGFERTPQPVSRKRLRMMINRRRAE